MSEELKNKIIFLEKTIFELNALLEAKNNKIQELDQIVSEQKKNLAEYKSTVSLMNKEIEGLIFKVSEQLKIASEIQKFIQPTQIPLISGVEFSTKFLAGNKAGGDYFDLLESSDKHKITFLMSSASGYGVSSLLMSILIKMSTLREIKKGTTPARVIELVHNELKPVLMEKDKASLFIGMLDKKNFEFTYSCSGQFIGYIQNGTSGDFSKLNQTQDVISKTGHVKYSNTILNINQFDRIILTTLGLILNKNKGGKCWTEDGILAVLRKTPRKGVHEMRNEVLFQFEQFIEGSEIERDVTVLAAEIKDPVIKLAST